MESFLKETRLLLDEYTEKSVLLEVFLYLDLNSFSELLRLQSCSSSTCVKWLWLPGRGSILPDVVTLYKRKYGNATQDNMVMVNKI